jgi:hypothetical protein
MNSVKIWWISLVSWGSVSFSRRALLLVSELVSLNTVELFRFSAVSIHNNTHCRRPNWPLRMKAIHSFKLWEPLVSDTASHSRRSEYPVRTLWRTQYSANTHSLHTHTHTYTFVGRDSSVGIANRYGQAGPRIGSQWGREFPHPSTPTLGLTQPPIQWVPGLSRE